MIEEENIKSRLVEKFGYLNDKVRVQRVRRLVADVPMANFAEVFDYAVKELGFEILTTITGLDEGPTLGFIYHIARTDGIVLNLHTNAPKEKPELKTITPYFPAADAYERELVDLLRTGTRPAPRKQVPFAGRLARKSVSSPQGLET